MKNKLTRYINGFFWVLFFAITILFFIIQATLYDPFSHKNYTVEQLTEDACVVFDDGTKIPVGIKNGCYDYDGVRNKVATIEVKLPVITKYNYTVSLLSNEQTIRLYIDDELRNTYDDEDFHLLKNNVASNVVSIYLTPEDSEKTLRIEYLSGLSDSARILCTAYYATEIDFFCWVLNNALPQVLSGVILLVLGSLLIIIGLYFILKGRDDRGISPLGVYSFIVAAWLFFRSNLRAYYLNHIGSAETISYFCLMLAPVPVMMFFNLLMKYEYQRLYTIATVIIVANLAISGLCELFNVVNVIAIAPIMQVLIILVCIMCLITTVLYARKNKLENGEFIIVGLVGFIAATLAEDIGRVFLKEQFVGKYIGTGMLFFLLMIAYSAFKNIAYQQQELADVKRQNDIKNEFLANMSHEIRTPINTIMGMDEMILRENEEQNINHYATNIANASKTLLAIVDDILDYSKIESGKMEIFEKRYNLVKVLLEVIDATSLRAIKKNINFEYNVDESIPALLLGDETRVRQVLNNILTNAVKYTNVGKVTLNVSQIREEEDTVELIFSVSDTGIGIKPEDKERLFDSFVRLDNKTNRSIEGTGLGMAITKQIVEMLEGTIDVVSEYGKGSTFTFRFRQKIVDNTPVGNISKHRKISYNSQDYVEQYIADGLQILVVDDNEMNVEVIVGLLKHTNANIDAAISGFECLDKIKEKKYDLIFLDHMMPNLDGIETLQKIKLMDEYDITTPVIALTANALIGAKEEYIRKGFADYLSKPVEYKELVKMIEKYVPQKFKRSFVNAKKTYNKNTFLENNGIQVNDALKYSGDSMAQYLKLVDIFISEKGKEKQRLLHDAYLEENWSNYLTYVHGLKNTAKMVGANELSDIAYQHEMQTKAENIDFILDNFYELDDKWSKVSEILETYVKGNGIIDNGDIIVDSQKELSDMEKRDSIDRIIALLNDFKRGDALNLLGKYVDYKWDTREKDKILEAIKLVQAYEYEMAIDIIQSIV